MLRLFFGLSDAHMYAFLKEKLFLIIKKLYLFKFYQQPPQLFIMKNALKSIFNISPRKKFRAKLRIAFIVLAAVSTYFISYLFEEQEYCWAIIPFSLILLISIAEFVVADIITDRKYPRKTEMILDRLEAKIADCENHMRHIIDGIINQLNTNKKDDISGTFHLKVDLYYDTFLDDTETALVQLIKYSGSLGGRKWRFTPATKGIIGKCLRTQQEEQVNFQDEKEFEKGMVRDFGFTDTELKKVTRSGRSYYAHPVIYKTQIVGVLYLFSTEPNIFPNSIPDIGLITSSSNSIASYLKGANIIG